MGKVGEEGVEVALAAALGTDQEIKNEIADLVFHVPVLMRSKSIDIDDITEVLLNRMR